MKSASVLPQARLFRFSVPGIAPALAVPFEQLFAVARLTSVTRIPAMPPTILGLGRWQDLPVVVIDLRRVLGTAAESGRLPDFLTYHQLVLKIVFDNQVNLVAFPVLPGGQVVSVPLSLPRAEMPAEIAAEAVHQAVLVGENRLLLLDTLHLPALIGPLQIPA